MQVNGMNAAKWRYFIRFLVTMGVYVAVSLTIVHYMVRSRPTGPIVYFLAVLPAIPIIGSMVVVGLYLAEEKDEFQRAMFERSLLWGMGGTLATTSTLSCLQMFAHIHLGSAAVPPLFWVFSLFWVLTSVGRLVLDVHYRSCNG